MSLLVFHMIFYKVRIRISCKLISFRPCYSDTFSRGSTKRFDKYKKRKKGRFPLKRRLRNCKMHLHLCTREEDITVNMQSTFEGFANFPLSFFPRNLSFTRTTLQTNSVKRSVRRSGRLYSGNIDLQLDESYIYLQHECETLSLF